MAIEVSSVRAIRFAIDDGRKSGFREETSRLGIRAG